MRLKVAPPPPKLRGEQLYRGDRSYIRGNRKSYKRQIDELQQAVSVPRLLAPSHNLGNAWSRRRRHETTNHVSACLA